MVCWIFKKIMKNIMCGWGGVASKDIHNLEQNKIFIHCKTEYFELSLQKNCIYQVWVKCLQQELHCQLLQEWHNASSLVNCPPLSQDTFIRLHLLSCELSCSHLGIRCSRLATYNEVNLICWHWNVNMQNGSSPQSVQNVWTTNRLTLLTKGNCGSYSYIKTQHSTKH